ncbi:MAG: DUF58 domain-containing protein [Tepidisphaerales bacterium]
MKSAAGRVARVGRLLQGGDAAGAPAAAVSDGTAAGVPGGVATTGAGSATGGVAGGGGGGATLVKRKPRWDFSIAGLMYVTMTMFMGIAAMNTQANLLFGVFGLMLSVGLVCFVISRLMLTGLTVRRLLPDAAVVGVPVAVGYEFHNGKRFWPSMSVQVSELDGVQAFVQQPHAYLLHAAAGTSAAVKVEVTPKRRGVYSLGAYQVSTGFPFGFVKRAVTRYQADSLVIFPPLAEVDGRLLRWLRSSETAGVTVRPQRGGEDEVYGVKEYRGGENPRLIHWKRSARTGQLVAREMTRVSPPRVMVVVDTWRADDAAGSVAAAERAVAVAASLASELLEQGLLVGLAAVQGDDNAAGDGADDAAAANVGRDDGDGLAGSAVGGGGRVVLMQPNRGKRHRRDVLSVLARLETGPDVSVDALMSRVMRTVRAGTTLVLVTSRGLAGPAGGTPGVGGAAEAATGGGLRWGGDGPSWAMWSGRQQGHDGVVVLNVMSPLARAWFRFSPTVDFSLTMPPAASGTLGADAGRGGRLAREMKAGVGHV